MVQTWLPLPSYVDSIHTLTDTDLGLQRIHVLEILEHFHDVEVSQLPKDYEAHDLRDHPIILMWAGYEMQLCEYGLVCSEEWMMRKGRRDWIYKRIADHLNWATSEDAEMNKPNWFGDVDFHLSHQAALLRKNRTHYSRYFVADGERQLVWPASDHAS